MALVEYSSSSDSEADHQDEAQQPPSKRRRTSPPPPPSPAGVAPTPSGSSATRPNKPEPEPEPKSGGRGGAGGAALPPLPPSFHDLYASTVRAATADLPSLHHGRRRVIPHREGNWPSHLYAEWHPPAPQHALLRALLASLAAALAGPEGGGKEGEEEELPPLLPPPPARGALAGFLESGLGAPLPLHVSLSRPFVLRTADKGGFLDALVREVQGCGVGAFALVCDGLVWHRSPDSNRSFLVLRVRSSSPPPPAGDGGGGARNPELSALLARCNDLVSSYGQPELYAASHPSQQQGGPGGEEGGGDAFHVSIAWSFAEPTDEIRRRTAEVFARPEFRDAVARDITIPVEGLKAKIGNVVTNIELLGRKKGRKGRGLFGEV